ncbi:MAG: Mut7-C ubiquitin/RNAse domain-containing protein [Desulfofustis sp.]|nr:Mut7-C ubiquitin/RNAse domain-containing protein [Desulfofustis sp.]
MSSCKDEHLQLTLHGDLADLLLRQYRQDTEIRYPLSRRASIKDILEAMGIPHTEIGGIQKAAQQLDFSYLPEPGEKLNIYPVPAGPAALQPSVLRPDPPTGIRFLVDINVARLAVLLRMAGFDTVSLREEENVPGKREVAQQSRCSGRIILSRDKELLKHREVAFGRLVRTQDPKVQLYEIVDLYGLRSNLEPFSRCLRCNGLLIAVHKQRVMDQLEPLTKKYYYNFMKCGSCSQVYWKGSHHEKMIALLKPIMA